MKYGKKLVYISHPSGGLESNTLKVEEIIKKIYKTKGVSDEYCIVSPIHCYGFMYSDYEDDYLKGLSFCIDLLQRCDLMLLCGDWRSSRGCKEEMAMCAKLNIPVYKIPNDKALDSWLDKATNK